MTDRALRRWLAPLVPALLLVAACSQPVTGTPQAAAGGGDRTSTERSAEADVPELEPDDESASNEPEPDSDSPSGLGPLVGTWEGHYTCAQGVTGVKFAVEPVDESTVRAVFEFFPLPENPDAKAGSYQLLGAYRGDRLVFEQEKWISQPENYVMVDVEVTSPVVAGMNTITGTMLTSGCDEFSVSRTD